VLLPRLAALAASVVAAALPSSAATRALFAAVAVAHAEQPKVRLRLAKRRK
jgi:hypothetical protein